MALFSSLVAPILGGAVNTLLGNRGERRAADASAAGYQAGIDEMRAAREQNQQNIQPYLNFGQTGINRLEGLLANPDSIANTSAYRFMVDQGTQTRDRSAASRGGLYGGGHQADLMAFGQGLASQEYGNEWNRLMGVAGLGQNSAVGANALNQQTAGNIAGLMGGQGNARASSYGNQANNWGQFATGALGQINDWYRGRNG